MGLTGSYQRNMIGAYLRTLLRLSGFKPWLSLFLMVFLGLSQGVGRIALARALLRRPAMLLLDEATNALDPESERKILDALNRLHGELTIVMIAHHSPSILRADRIVVIDGGRTAPERAGETVRSRTGPLGSISPENRDYENVE